VRVFLTHFNPLYIVENAVEQKDRAMRRWKKETYMSPSEYLEFMERVDRDIRKLPSYRGRPPQTGRGTLFTFMLDRLHPDTQANLQFDLREEEMQDRGDLDAVLRKVSLLDGKDLRAAVEAKARSKVEKTKSKPSDKNQESSKRKGSRKKKRSEDESVICSTCGRNSHSVDQCWFENRDKAPKNLRKYFTKKKAMRDSSTTQGLYFQVKVNSNTILFKYISRFIPSQPPAKIGCLRG